MALEANLKLKNVIAYAVKKFDIVVGEDFEVELTDAGSGPLKWFADNDPVLNIIPAADGKSAQMRSLASGNCEIQVQKPDRTSVINLSIKVYSLEAQRLEATATTEKIPD